jgi:hypothetical protein
MKNLIKLALTISLILVLCIASGSVRKEHNSKPVLSSVLYKENLKTYKIPGFLVRYAMLITEDSRRIRPALKGVSSINISITEGVNNSKSVFTRINNTLSENNYLNILEIIDPKSQIVVKTLENNNIIREMVLMINDDSTIVCISIKGKISPENLLKVITELTV